jgi:mono/diheme cytochrome c family protein
MRVQSQVQPLPVAPLLSLAWLTLILASAGCADRTSPGRTYMPDMAEPVSYDAYAPNPVTRSHQTLLRPVAGTVPRGFHPLHFAANAEGAEQAGRELRNPLAATPQNLARGERVYQTFCRVCHGAAGRGDGPIIPLFPSPPDYLSVRLRGLPEGQIFHTITYGTALMPSYASQILPEDRWRAVLYVRHLQAVGGREVRR